MILKYVMEKEKSQLHASENCTYILLQCMCPMESIDKNVKTQS